MILPFLCRNLSRMQRPVRALAGAALVAGLVPSTLSAVQSESVTHQTFADFSEGELKNVSLHRDGRMTLAPGVSEVGRLIETVIWSVAAAPDGTIFIGAGNEGMIYRLGLDGKTEELFSTDEVLTRAMAVDGEGRLYVGTSPNGKVYRYTGDGEAEVVFDPRETYIWSLLFNPAGDLFVGTGDEGRIYRVAAGAEAGATGEIYFDGDESHISTLAWDGQDRLLAGTSPNGYVYRIEGPDEVSILFNSPDEEIRQMLPGDEGEIYVSTFTSASAKEGQPSGWAAIAQAVAALASATESAETDAASKPTTATGGNGSARPSTLYRLDADGFYEPFWGLFGVTIHSLLKLDDGSLLIGTGDEGRIFSLAGFQNWNLRQTLPTGSRVSALMQIPGTPHVVAFSSNPARIYRLDFGLSGTGEFVSKIFDGRQVSRWGRLYTETVGGEDEGLQTHVRSGNTEKADSTWTPWRAVNQEGLGSGATVPGRYFQYRLSFSEPEAEARRVRFFYRHANAAPVIQSLRAVTSSLGLERFELPPQQPAIDLDQFGRETGTGSGQPPQSREQIRSYEQAGTVTAVWKARDANGDALVYTLNLRRAGTDDWDTIAAEMKDSFYSFNSNGLPDGEYQVQVVATDRLSNRAVEAREASRTSESFLIDNTAPEIEVETVQVSGDSATVSFAATDRTSILVTASYTLDGADPVVLFPEDGIFDAREKRFQIELEALAPGRRSLLIYVVDESGNRRISQVPVEVKAGL